MENKSGQSYARSSAIQNSLSDTLVPLFEAETFQQQEEEEEHSPALTHLNEDKEPF